MPNTDGRPDLAREIGLQQSKDMRRSIDYLEEKRSEIDIEKLAFLGVSWGAAEGPHLIAVEPRFKTAVLILGCSTPKRPAEIDPWNFASRIKIPVLMLNGKSDFFCLFETAQKPLFDLLGTPEADKLHICYEGGHDILNRRDVYRDMMYWLDRYLGPIKTKSVQ